MKIANIFGLKGNAIWGDSDTGALVYTKVGHIPPNVEGVRSLLTKTRCEPELCRWYVADGEADTAFRDELKQATKSDFGW